MATIDEQKQAQALEAYLHALREDIDALPPPELDTATADFARKLIRTQAAPHLSQAVQDKLWRQALHVAQNPFEPFADTQQKEQVMYSNEIKPTQRRERSPLAWLVAVAVVALVGLLAAMMVNPPPASDQTAAVIGVEQSDPDQPEPIDSVLPTSSAVDPLALYQPVLTAFIPIPVGTRIREDMLVVVLWPNYQMPSGAFDVYADVVGKYAIVDIPRFMPILDDFISDEFPFPLMTVTPVVLPITSTLTLTTTPTNTSTPTSTAMPTSTSTPTPLSTHTLTPTFTPAPTDVSG